MLKFLESTHSASCYSTHGVHFVIRQMAIPVIATLITVLLLALADNSNYSQSYNP